MKNVTESNLIPPCLDLNHSCLGKVSLGNYIDAKFREQSQTSWLWISMFSLMVIVLLVVLPSIIYLYYWPKRPNTVERRVISPLDSPRADKIPMLKLLTAPQERTNNHSPQGNSPLPMSEAFGVTNENDTPSTSPIMNTSDKYSLKNAMTMNRANY